MLCLLPVVPYMFFRRHVLDRKGVMAFLLAIVLFAIYYSLFVWLGWIPNDLKAWF